MIVARSCALLALISLLSPGLALAQPELVERALRSLDRADARRWAFTETITENGTTRVARHDPTRPEDERWTLVTVDEQPPTDEQREAFAARLVAEQDEQSEAEEIRSMITPGTLEMVEQTATDAVFRFKPTSEDEDDREFNERLVGTLRVAGVAGDPRLQSVELRASKPFSAAFGVKIKAFSLLMTYAPVGSAGAVLPREVRIELRGRAMLVKKIEERVEVRFDDYVRVGD